VRWLCLLVVPRSFLDGGSIAKVQAVLPLRGLLMSQARALLADDNPAILEKVASRLASEFDDVVVLDISIPVWDGIKAAARLT
jgi:CheY-like chemotaxis protein